jgi:hypothetical protein
VGNGRKGLLAKREISGKRERGIKEKCGLVEKDKGKSVDVRIRPDIFDFILDLGDF